jgi:hypothetical protein
METGHRDDWARLAAHIELRLNDLRLQFKDIPDRGGPSTAKVREMRNGSSHTLSRSKRRDLERALEWAQGSVEAVLAGGNATVIRTPRSRLDAIPTSDLVGQIRSMFNELVNRIPEVGIIVDKSEDWPQGFIEGAPQEPPTVRRRQDGE